MLGPAVDWSRESNFDALGLGVPPLPLWAHGEPAAMPALLFSGPRTWTAQFLRRAHRRAGAAVVPEITALRRTLRAMMRSPSRCSPEKVDDSLTERNGHRTRSTSVPQ